MKRNEKDKEKQIHMNHKPNQERKKKKTWQIISRKSKIVQNLENVISPNETFWYVCIFCVHANLFIRYGEKGNGLYLACW